jgi:hypothetical protein
MFDFPNLPRFAEGFDTAEHFNALRESILNARTLYYLCFHKDTTTHRNCSNHKSASRRNCFTGITAAVEMKRNETQLAPHALVAEYLYRTATTASLLQRRAIHTCQSVYYK